MDINKIKKDFPIFLRQINGKRIIYLDSTATSLKPQAVIDALNDYYSKYTASVFRGIYKIAEEATAKYEEARKKVARFINARSEKEIVFVRSATEAINLVAYSWGRLKVGENDEVVTTIVEHHSNFVPWQQLTAENGGILKVLDITNEGQLYFNDIYNYSKELKTQSASQVTLPSFTKATESKQNLKLEEIITKRSKLLAVTHVSNVLGTINPIKNIVAAIKRVNPQCLVLIDGAQAVPHMKVNVQDLGCDFYAFSGHKMLGPSGTGVLWARLELLEEMAPFNFGGGMIKEVHIDHTEFKSPPHKFEAGTPHIAGAIGLGAAVDYLTSVGMERVRQHEIELTDYALRHLNNIYHLSIYGPKKAEDRGGVIAFNLFSKNGKLIHGHDVAQILDEENIYIRSGHHCTMPLHERLGVPATARASFYIYNTKEDVDRLVEGLAKVSQIFANKRASQPLPI